MRRPPNEDDYWRLIFAYIYIIPRVPRVTSARAHAREIVRAVVDRMVITGLGNADLAPAEGPGLQPLKRFFVIRLFRMLISNQKPCSVYLLLLITAHLPSNDSLLPTVCKFLNYTYYLYC